MHFPISPQTHLLSLVDVIKLTDKQAHELLKHRVKDVSDGSVLQRAHNIRVQIRIGLSLVI
jgi:hypothetical protein